MKAFLALDILAVPAVAAADESDPIIVTGRSLSTPVGVGAYGSVLIDRARLALNASGRIEDVLADVAGFQQFRRTDSRAANPTSQGATLRALGGNASSRALVLLDGVPQADPFSGYIPYSALRPERLSSARITRGGGAGAFGVGAVAGTIELESGGPETLPALSAGVSGGSRNASEVSGGLVQRRGAGFVTAQAGWDRGDGYIPIAAAQRGSADVPARYDVWSLALRGVVPMSPTLEIQASALLFDDHRLRGLSGTASRSNGRDASIKLVSRGRWGFEMLAYVQDRGFRSGFVAVTPDRSATTPTLDQFNTPSTGLGAKIEVRPPVGDGNSLRIGADLRRASGVTNEFFRFVAGAPTRLRRAGGNGSTMGGFIEGGTIIGPLTLTGGARIDRWSINDGVLNESVVGTGDATLALVFPERAGTRTTFRGGAMLKLSDRIELRAAGYTGFRVPTLNELYRPFRVGADATAANGALGLERLKGFEGGVGLSAGKAKIGVTAFWNQLDGAIANVSLGVGPGNFDQVGFVAAGGVFRQRLNVDAIKVRGLEASASVSFGDFRFSASYALADARVRATGVAASLDGKRPAQTPLHQGSATLAYLPAARVQASVSVRYAGPQFEDDLETRRLPQALTVDAVASVPLIQNVRLVARVENLFNERVVSGVSAAGVQDLGTPQTVWLGLTFSR
jgi:vitamin B12 transporter